MKEIKTPLAPAAIGPYSQAVVFGNLLFTSGQIAIDSETSLLDDSDIRTETYRVFKNLKAVLEAADMDFSHVLKVSIFLRDMLDFDLVNQIYAEHFTPPYPARETIQVAGLPKGVGIEISLIAGKTA